jgi:uncharacterized protein YhaN
MRPPIDPDLAALQATITALLEGRHSPVDRADVPVESLSESVQRLRARSERLLGGEPGSSRLELEGLLTESSAQGCMLEVERLRTKRRMLAALAGVTGGAPQEVLELATRHRTITAELERLEAVIARLRAELHKS